MRVATNSTVKKLTPVAIATGSIEARNQPFLDRVAARAENDRDRGCGLGREPGVPLPGVTRPPLFWAGKPNLTASLL
jgi:hypothetical protein